MLFVKKTVNWASVLTAVIFCSGCATITNDPYVPIALSFSDGSSGSCNLRNKRQTIKTELPGTPMIRRSDDSLSYDCETDDGLKAFGSIPSSIGAAKLGASVIFFDMGITDAITDKHREYPTNFVIPIAAKKWWQQLIPTTMFQLFFKSA